MHNKMEKNHSVHKNVEKKDVLQDAEKTETVAENGQFERNSGVKQESNVQIENDTIKNLQDKLAEEHDMHMRALATLDNLKKRVQREREEMRTSVISGFVEDLLPVLDHFELGLQSAAQDGTGNILAGFKMIFDQFKSILSDYSLVVIDPINQAFNPHEQDCVRREYSDSQPENTVLLVMRKGYKIRDHLIRPASVVVSTKQQAQEHE